jgi:F-type H+-transporting ATPase subunit a
MPEHTTFITYLLSKFPALRENAHNIGSSFIGNQAPTWRSFEPIITSLLVIVLVVTLAFLARRRVSDIDKAVVPDDTLTLRTFMEVFVGYFYGLAKDVMGPKRAKRYFSIVGGAACFIFFSNVMALIPGLAPPTSSLNVTLGCAVCVFIVFNFYGMQANGLGYFKHMAGPQIILAPLIFFIELISMCVRPVTLAVRLMVNMAVDHLLGTIAIGIVTLLVPIPLMFLGIIVILVQTLVFSLLTSIYIGLATEHEEHH